MIVIILTKIEQQRRKQINNWGGGDKRVEKLLSKYDLSNFAIYM